MEDLLLFSWIFFFLQKETQIISQNIKAIIHIKFLYVFFDLTTREEPNTNQNTLKTVLGKRPPGGGSMLLQK